MKKRKKSGFTLFEVLIYSTLIAVFLGFAFVSAHNIIASRSSTEKINEVAAGQDLIERKIFWLINQTSRIEAPSPNSSGTALTFRTVSSGTDPATISLSGTTLFLSLAGAPPVALNNNRIAIDSFSATNISNAQATSSLVITVKTRDANEPQISSTLSFFSAIK